MSRSSWPFTTIAAILWIAGLVGVRLAGQWLFNPRSLNLLALFALSLPLVWLLTFPLYRRFTPLDPAGQTRAALQLVTLPVLLQLPAFLFHSLLFPNMGDQRMVYYAAYLFYFYGLMLATGWMRERPSAEAGE